MLADMDADPDRVAELWSLINRGASPIEILSVLTAAGLAETPSFVLIEIDEKRVSAFVRGTGRGRVSLRGQDVEIDSRDTQTWAEYALAGPAAELELWLAEESRTAPSLPFKSGVVRADRLVIHIDESRSGWAAANASTAADIEAPYVPPVENLEGNNVAARSEPLAASCSAGADVVAAPRSDSGYDHLFGATILRRVEEAAIRAAETAAAHNSAADTADQRPAPSGPPAVGPTDAGPPPTSGSAVDVTPTSVNIVTFDDDSKERTVSLEMIDEQLGNARDIPVAPAPTVQATRCPNGHPNPVHLLSCRACQAQIPDQVPVDVPRPVLGTLQVSTGDAIPLDRGVLLGRSPDPDRLVGGERPHYVKVPSPGKDISRNHLEVRLDGWQVLVVDLGSTNGTTITPPGLPAKHLKPDQPAPIEPGTVISLSDEVTCTFGVIS